MFCMKCGTQLPDDALFCYKCGNKINISPVVSEPTNTPAVENTKPEQEKNSYRIGNKIVRFNEEYAVYIQIIKVLNAQSKKAVKEFTSSYYNWDDAATASGYAYGKFNSLIKEGFLSCKSIALEHSVYDYSVSKINEYQWQQITEPFRSAYHKMRSDLNSINQEQRNGEIAREIRKESRSRVVGGGFGIQGAVKGMAIAGAVNLGTGIAHSAFNLVGNAFSSWAASSARSDLYNSSLGQLQLGIRESFERLLPVIAKIITGKVHVDKNKELTIYKHIKEGAFGDNFDLRNPFAEAFQAFPFDEELYLDYIHRFPDEEKKIMAMGKDIGMDLEEIFYDELHYYGFEFHSIIAAEHVKSIEEPFFRVINRIAKPVFKRKISKTLNEEKGVRELNSLELVHGMLARYSMPDLFYNKHEEIEEYRKQKLAFFSKMNAAVAKTCHETPLRLNISNIGITYFYIAFVLRLCKIVNDEKDSLTFNSRLGKLYVGVDITPEIEYEIRKMISNHEEARDASDIYLCYHNRKDSNRKYIVLTSNGIVNQDHYTSFIKLNTEYKKGKFLDDFLVNDEDWDIHLSGEDLQWMVDIINGIQPFCGIVNIFVRLKEKMSAPNSELYDLIGTFYYYGMPNAGFAENRAKAKYWVEKGAALGNKNSEEMLLNKEKYWGDLEAVPENEAMADFSFPGSAKEIIKKEETKNLNKNVKNKIPSGKDYSPKFDLLYQQFSADELKKLSDDKGIKFSGYITHDDSRSVRQAYTSDLSYTFSQVKLLCTDGYSSDKGFLMTESHLVCSERPNTPFALDEIEYLRFALSSGLKVFIEPANVLILKTYDDRLPFFEKLNEIVFGFNANLATAPNRLTPEMVDQGFLDVRNSLSQEQIQELNNTGERIYILESIPEKKAKNAINSYAKDTGIKSSDIKLLFDCTFMGSGKDGLIMTNQFIMDYKNKRPVPLNQIQYLRLETDDEMKNHVYAEPMHLWLMYSFGNIKRSVLELLIDKINQYIFRYTKRQSEGTDNNSANAESLKLFTSFKSKNKDYLDEHSGTVMVCEDISDSKVRNVLLSYAKGCGLNFKDIRLLFDNTLFGGAKEGFIITDKALIGSSNKTLIPLEQVKFLNVVIKEGKVYAEPMHLCISECTTNDFVIEGINRINKDIFGWVVHKTAETGDGNEHLSGNLSEVRQFECPVCKHLIDEGVAFCDNCGTSINWGDTNETSTATQGAATAQQYVCPTCGHLINYKDAFCDNCGTQISWE